MPYNVQGKKVAVIGSRDFEDKDMMFNILTKNLERIKMVVSGGARGADTLATDWAAEYGVPYLVFPAKWHDPFTGEYDRGAGFRRNRYIVEEADIILAFWDGNSSGTNHTIQMAKDLGKEVRIFKFTPKPKVDPELEKARQEAIADSKEERKNIERELRKSNSQEVRVEATVLEELPEVL